RHTRFSRDWSSDVCSSDLIFIQFAAIFDEYYAEDISQRAKDSILYRKAKGIGVGKPPFGTIRGEDGYLKPIEDGAWLLQSGKFRSEERRVGKERRQGRSIH